MNHPEYTASVVRTDSGPMLSINGRLEIPTGYSGGNGSVLRMFYEAGYRLHWVSLDMYAGYYYRKFNKLPMWLADGKFDFRQIDRELSRRLCYAPECPLILSVCLHPYENFAEVHPESAWRDTDGNLVRIGCFIFSRCNEGRLICLWRRKSSLLFRRVSLQERPFLSFLCVRREVSV